MTKHMMLLFLSDVKTNQKTGEVARAWYRNIPPRADEERPETQTTNESAVRYLLGQRWQGEPIQKLDQIFLIASKMVRGAQVPAKEAAMQEEDGTRRQMTHLEYFQHRMEVFHVPADICCVIPYDEDAAVPKSMELAADIAHRVLVGISAQRDKGNDVVLHVDMTGGLRHANMLMLNILRLLQYSGVTIGKVLYSNFVRKPGIPSFVEEVDDIYHTLDLIAGAEEFARFGSVDAIEQYFAHRETSPELQKLLHTMHDFSNEIKLCHQKQFLVIVDDLHEALDDFSKKYADWKDGYGRDNSAAEQINDKLMLQLEQRLQHDYARLLDFHRNPLEAVRWCIEHSYLQQAVLIMTEMMPVYLIARAHLLTLEDSFLQEIRSAQKKESSYREMRLTFFFWNHFFHTGKARKDPELKPILDMKTDKARGILHQQCCHRPNLVKAFRAGTLAEAELLAQLENIRKAQFPNHFFASKNEIPQKLREAADVEAAMIWLEDDLTMDVAYPLLHLIHEIPPRVTSLLSEAELRDIIRRYWQLKDERNLEGHVKEIASPFQNAESLKEFLTNFIQRLEELHRLHPVEGKDVPI